MNEKEEAIKEYLKQVEALQFSYDANDSYAHMMYVINLHKLLENLFDAGFNKGFLKATSINVKGL